MSRVRKQNLELSKFSKRSLQQNIGNKSRKRVFFYIQSLYGVTTILYEFVHVTSNWENRPSSIHTHNLQKRRRKKETW